MLRASAKAELAGVPSVSIISTGFLKQAEVVTKGLGLPNMAIAEFPGVPMTWSTDELRKQVVDKLLPRIIEGLTQAIAEPEEDGAAEPEPRDIVFRGAIDELHEHYYGRHWSDGLPVIPPTLARVDAFLRYTNRKPDEVLGVCPPANREATVWNVAVTGVMAGCRPEYMPILIAATEAVLDPVYKAEDAGSTPGWETLLILSGPIARELGFNDGQGVMRMGRQPNTSVGRFMRLMLRNIGGFHHAPEGADKGSIGQSFLVVMPENEDWVREMGWQPFSVDRGFHAGENIVTAMSVVAVSAPTYSGTEKAEEHMAIIADVMGQRACGYWTAIGMVYSNWHPLLVLGPSIAKVFAKDGWSKDDIRQHLYENVKIPASQAERYAYHAGLTGFRVNNYVKQGLLPPAFGESEDPDRLVPVFHKPEWINIVVAGDWGRNQSKCYVNNHIQGPPVSRRIELPANWKMS